MDILVAAVILSLFPAGFSHLETPNFCRLDDVALQSPQAEKQRDEIYLALILPVHHFSPESGATCGILDERDILYLETFFWAINTYNERHTTELGVRNLRGVALDSCGSADRIYQRLQDWIYCQPSQAVAKPNVLAYMIIDNGDVVARVAKLLNQTGDILINMSPHNPHLEGIGYPNYYQVTPGAEQEAAAITELLINNNWKLVNVVYVEDEYGRSALNAFSTMASEKEIAIKTIEHVPPRADDTLVQSSLKETFALKDAVVVVFAYGKQKTLIHNLMRGKAVIISAGNLEDYGRTIASEVSGVVLSYEPKMDNDTNTIIRQLSQHLGNLTLNRTDMTYPSFETFFNQKLNCIDDQGMNTCSPDQQLGNASVVSPSPTAIITQSVDLVIGQFHEITKSCPNKSPQCDRYNFNAVKTEYQSNFQLPDQPGSTSGNYIPYQMTVDGKTVVYRNTGAASVARGSGDQAGRTHMHGTRWDLDHGWVIAIGVLAGLGIILVIVTAVIIIRLYKKTARISYVLLYAFLLFGAFVGYLTLFAFIPIPTTATCGITRFGIGLSYGICLSVMVIIALIMFKKLESSFALRIFIYFAFALLVCIEIVILVTWFILVPPRNSYVIDNRGVVVSICNHYSSESLTQLRWSELLRTPFENHLLALVYIMFLILLLIILGIAVLRNRNKLKKDPMLQIEAYLILSAGVGSAVLWIAWALVGGLLKTHAYAQEFADASLAFGLWLILTLLVVLLLVQLFFCWRNTTGRLHKRITVPVISDIDNRHVTDERHDETITAITTSATDRPITIVDSDQPRSIEMTRVDDIRNHTNKPNGNVTVTKQTKTEVVTHAKEVPVHTRDHERYAAHMSQAKLSGASDRLGHQHHRHHDTSNQHPNSSFFCSACGYGIDPNALHLKHPRSDKGSSHNTSVFVADSSGQLANGDTSFAQSDLTTHNLHEHLYTKGPRSIYSSPTMYYSNRRPESIYSTNQRVMRVSRELTGHPPSRYGMSFSEYDRIGYPKRSFRRTKSEEQLGSL